MGFLKKIFGKNDSEKNKNRVAVIGLDGVPFSFINKLIENGHLPFMKNLIEKAHFQQMKSVIPTISSVAWSTYMTGKDCTGHGIFGFIDRIPEPFSLYIPLARDMKSRTLWKHLSDEGKRVFVMNVPVTYPPENVNGILISGFLCTDINKVSNPPEVSEELKDMDYVIDVDAWVARKSKDEFMDILFDALNTRFNVLNQYYEKEDWDYFHCHVMDTDRISHFFWREYESGSGKYHDKFIEFFDLIDSRLKEFYENLREDTSLIVLSDHGFCLAEKELYLNNWLEDRGYLKVASDEPKSIKDLDFSCTRAYSLIPGRIYINLKGREENGIVEKHEYENLRDELIKGILEIKDPETGKNVIQAVHKREDIYDGEYLERCADLIAVPFDGVDIKGNLDKKNLLETGFISGMHTYHDAFFCMDTKHPDPGKPESIRDCYNIVLKLLDIK